MASKKGKKKAQKKQTAPALKNHRQVKPDLWFHKSAKWAPFIVFFIVTAVFFREQLFGRMYFWASFMSDYNELHIPYQTFAIEHIRNFQLPFWNPYTFGGMPFLADIQAGFFYPLNLILALFVPAGKLPVTALQNQIIFHFLIAQFSMYFLARHFKISKTGSTIAALSYSFSGIMVSRIIIQTFIYQLSWFPLLFLFFYRSVNELKLRFALLAGGLLSMLMLTGHYQALFYNGVFIALFIIWQGIQGIIDKEYRGRRLFLYAGFALFPVVLALGLSALQWLHTAEAALLSQRTLLTFAEASDGSLHFSQLFSAVVPKLFGYTGGMKSTHIPFYLSNKGYHYWETSFYFGIPALMLGLVGFIYNIRRKSTWFFVFIIVFGIMHALGINSFLFQFLFHLPGFDKFRFPARTMYYVVFAFSIFAGFGFDYLRNQKDNRFKAGVLAAVGIPLLTAAGISSGIIPSLLSTPLQFMDAVQGYGLTALLLTALSAAALLLLQKKIISAEIIGFALILLTAADLTINLAEFKNSTVSPDQVYKVNPKLKAMLTPNPPDDIFRVKMRNKYILPLRRNSGMIDKTMLLEGFNPLQLRRRFPPGKDRYDLLSVKYIIETDKKTRKSYFRQRENYFPHARMLYKTIVSDADHAGSVLKSGDVDLSNTAVLEKAPPFPFPEQDSLLVQNSVRCTGYRDSELKYTVSTEQNGLLALSEIWYPAWKAEVDGMPVDIMRINYCFRGIPLKAGRHIVRVFYDSDAFRLGLWISVLTLLLTAGIILFRKKLEPVCK